MSRTIEVPGIGRATYSDEEWAHVEELKASGSDTLLNELAFLHGAKVHLGATIRQHPDAAPVRAATTQRQEALFTE